VVPQEVDELLAELGRWVVCIPEQMVVDIGADGEALEAVEEAAVFADAATGLVGDRKAWAGTDGHNRNLYKMYKQEIVKGSNP
jgi:hypothetical protein